MNSVYIEQQQKIAVADDGCEESQQKGDFFLFLSAYFHLLIFN